MKQERERRFLAGVEVRAEGDAADAPPVVVGYAAVFDHLSEDMGGWREKIQAGAFAKTLGADVRALYNHDPNIVLARTKSGTLRLEEDQRGLRVEFTPPDTEMARHVIAAMRRGDVDQMSFGFYTRGQIWDDSGDEIVRTLTEVELFDVSIVTYPAYPDTSVAVRSLDAWRVEIAPPPPDFGFMRRRLELLGA